MRFMLFRFYGREVKKHCRSTMRINVNDIRYLFEKPEEYYQAYKPNDWLFKGNNSNCVCYN